MPARKTPIPGYKQRHYDAEELMERFSVSQSKAYEIIHQCRAYGEVLKIGGLLRVSECALMNWYEAQLLKTAEEDAEETPATKALAEWEAAHRRGMGRPRKNGGALYAE